ncbi:MAG: NUDIX hydrolase [Alphaproteobacteria bacterium]
MNDLPNVYGNAGVMVKYDNKLLVVKDIIGKWNVPSGKPLPGETAHQTATRETLEETGIKVKPIKLLKNFWNEFYLYEAVIDDPNFIFSTSYTVPPDSIDEISEVKFLPIYELTDDNVRFPVVLGAIKNIFDEIDNL